MFDELFDQSVSMGVEDASIPLLKMDCILEAVNYLFHLVTVVFVVTLPWFYPVYADSWPKRLLGLVPSSLFFWMMVLPVVLAVVAVI